MEKTISWIRTKDKLPLKVGYYTVSHRGSDWSWAYWNGDKWMPGPERDACAFDPSPMYWLEMIVPNKC